MEKYLFARLVLWRGHCWLKNTIMSWRALVFLTIIFEITCWLAKSSSIAQDKGVGLLSAGLVDYNCQECEEADPTFHKISILREELKIYRPQLFNQIRGQLDLTNDEFTSNLSPSNLICINSDSKSGQCFWVSKNGGIILKTIKHYEAKNLVRILDYYAGHVLHGELSCIASVLGLFRVKGRWGRGKKYFLACRNVFPAAESDSFIPIEKYDLKGSTVGRVASLYSSVAKDVDLLSSGKTLVLGDSLELFMAALKRDTDFLRAFGFMDYSLLVAVERHNIKNFHRFALSPDKLVTSLVSLKSEDRCGGGMVISIQICGFSVSCDGVRFFMYAILT